MDKLHTSQFDSLIKFSGNIKIGVFNSTFISKPLTEHKEHFLLDSKSTPKHLRWYDWRQTEESAPPWFFLIVLWQLKHWIRTGPVFWRTSPPRSTKFTKNTSRVKQRSWRLWRWLPSFVMTGLLLWNEVESWVVSMDKDFATNSSETSDRIYPLHLSTFFRVRLPKITSRNREITDFRQSFKNARHDAAMLDWLSFIKSTG